MDTRRFDRLTAALAGRMSRRSALRAGAASLVLPATGVAAQGATPEPLAEGERAYFLFVQVATSGTFTPRPGAEGAYTLILDHDAGETVYFSDRPERIVGTVPTALFLQGLGFTPDNPPNAALVAGEEVVVVELFNPVIDEASGTLTYDVQVLDDFSELGLEQLTAQSTGAVPDEFGSASLFIDDCPNGSISCNHCDGSNDAGWYKVGSLASRGFCYSWSSACCHPCGASTDPKAWDGECNSTFSSCGGKCFAMFEGSGLFCSGEEFCDQVEATPIA